MIDVVTLSLVAGIFSLDVTAFGQFMISRPIVCGPVFGLLLGDFSTGIWVGIIVEMIWINVIPMGAAVPSDTTTKALLTTIWGSMVFNGDPAGIVLALIVAVVCSHVFKWVDMAQRYAHIRLQYWVERGMVNGREGRIAWGVYGGVVLFYLKAVLFYYIVIALGVRLLPMLAAHLPIKVMDGFAQLWPLLPMIGFGIMLRNLHSKFFELKRNRV